MAVLCLVFAGFLSAENPNKAFSLSAGYGNSYGGVGLCFQLNATPDVSIHGGVGYFPMRGVVDFAKDVILLSIGIKYYYLKSDPIYLYADFQYGGLGSKAEEYLYWNGYTYQILTEQKNLYGPSFILGGDLRFGSFGLNAGLGLSYNLTKISWYSKRIFVAIDGGISFYF